MKIDESKSIWEHRYKPSCIEDLIIPNEVKVKFKKYVETQDLPPLGLFSSNPGTGKSSSAHAIVKEIDGEALWINASLEKGIDTLRGKISKFASSTSFDDNVKIVVMDEFDQFSRDGQAAFRGFLDEFSQNCRFIFTANYPGKIIEPLLDRLEIYDFNNFNKKEMIKPIFERLKFILNNENVTFDEKALVPVINTFYPGIRGMIGTLQKFSNGGEFSASESDIDNLNSFDTIIKLAKPKTYTEMITEVNKLNAPDNIFSYLYGNASKYYKPEQYPNVVLIIAKYQHMASQVRDKNLNASACLTELMNIK